MHALAFHLVFAAWMVFVRPPLLAASDAALHAEEANLWLGVAGLVWLVVDSWAFLTKFRASAAGRSPRLDADAASEAGVWLMLVGVLRTVVDVIVAMTCAAALGAFPEGPGDEGAPWGMTLVMVAALRGVGFMLFTLIAAGDWHPRPPSRWVGHVADVLGGLAAAFAFTVVWEAGAMSGPPLGAEGVAYGIFQAGLVALLFGLLVVPMELPWLFELTLSDRPKRDWRMWQVSLAVLLGFEIFRAW